MPPRLESLARLLERPAEAEVGEVVDGRALDDGRELVARRRIPAGAKVGPAERLADRGLVRLEGTRSLERDRRGREVAVLEQLAAALEQIVDMLAALARSALLL